MLIVNKIEKLKKDYNVTIGDKEYKLDLSSRHKLCILPDDICLIFILFFIK